MIHTDYFLTMFIHLRMISKTILQPRTDGRRPSSIGESAAICFFAAGVVLLRKEVPREPVMKHRKEWEIEVYVKQRKKVGLSDFNDFIFSPLLKQVIQIDHSNILEY